MEGLPDVALDDRMQQVREGECRGSPPGAKPAAGQDVHGYRTESDDDGLYEVEDLWDAQPDPRERREEEVAERRVMTERRQADDRREDFAASEKPDVLGVKAEVVVERAEAIVTAPDIEVKKPDPYDDGDCDYRETRFLLATIPQTAPHAVSEAGCRCLFG
jgi:hypothetical protein